jgi:hypothetical protein
MILHRNVVECERFLSRFQVWGISGATGDGVISYWNNYVGVTQTRDAIGCAL